MANLLGLDLEAPLQSGASIRVALIPVGDIDSVTFHRLAAILRPLTALDLFSITHGQSRGTLSIRFLEAGGGASDWDDLYPQRRVRAVVGLCHFPCERDLGRSFRAFMRRVEDFPSTTQVRCLVFEPPEASAERDLLTDVLQLPSAARSLVIVPPNRPAEVRLAVERLLEDLGSELLRDLRAEAEQPPTAPSTPIDAAASERSSISRLLMSASSRLSGRNHKRKADFRLMIGHPAEAKAGYERAIELLSRTGADAVWHAAALEGLSAATLLLVEQAAARSGGSESGGDGV